MGKSTTADMFRGEGVPVWDADAAVHRIYGPGGAAGGPLSQIVPEAVKQDGSVDRGALRDAIAQKPDLLDEIEQVVHPLVADDRNRFLEKNVNADIVLLDIPLLFETGGQSNVDRVVVVTTDAETQKQRVMQRPGMDEVTFERLLSRQVPDSEKRAKADYVIRTDNLEDTRQSVKELVSRLRQERAGNA
jgi:dephospho-CoA kinase